MKSEKFKENLIVKLAEIKREANWTKRNISQINNSMERLVRELKEAEEKQDSTKLKLLEQLELLEGLQEQFGITDEELESAIELPQNSTGGLRGQLNIPPGITPILTGRQILSHKGTSNGNK